MTISSIWVITSDYFSGIASRIFFKLIKIPNKSSQIAIILKIEGIRQRNYAWRSSPINQDFRTDGHCCYVH